MHHNPINAQARPNNKPQVADISAMSQKESPFNPTRGEEALWSAVITQALMDAGSKSRKPEAVQEKAKAIRWLLGDSEDFHTVCQNAGLDPAYVREKAKAAIARGCVWRKGLEKKEMPEFRHNASRFVAPVTHAHIGAHVMPCAALSCS